MTHRHIRSIAIALAATAAIAAPASASGQDLRSPDAADPSWQPTVANTDLRSPDAADPSWQPTVANTDLRSPDAADPYSGVPVQVVERAPISGHDRPATRSAGCSDDQVVGRVVAREQQPAPRSHHDS